MLPWARRAPLLVVVLLTGCGGGGAHDPHAAPAGLTPARVPGPLIVDVHRIGALPAPVQMPAVAALPGGRLLAMGGLDAADASSDAIVEVRRSGSARTVGRLPAALHDAAGATVGGRAYFVGGGDAGTGSANIVGVSPGARTTAVGRLPVGVSDVAAVASDRAVFVVGGYTGTVPLRSIMRFAPGRGVQVVGEMPHPLRYAAVAAAGDRLLIAGGTNGTTATRDILAFDSRTHSMRRIGRLPYPLAHASAAMLGGRMIVVGGRGDSGTSAHRAILAVDPFSGSVRVAGRLPVGLSDTAAAAVGGRVMVLGGRDARGRAHREVLGLSPALAARRLQPAAAIPSPNVYAADAPGRFAPAARGVPARIYVPNSKSNTVDVIDQTTGRRIARFPVGAEPQHVVPSWDLRTLYVAADHGNSVTPVDPRTGRPGKPIPVRDPYNLYFTADGRRAIVVAEQHRRLDFREPHTFRLRKSLPVPQCDGVDHMDFTADGHFALVSCEFAGRVIVVDLRSESVVKTIELRTGAMPQDVKLAPDGHTFYVADMMTNGVWLIGAKSFRKEGFLPTGAGAHGLYPSRDARLLYVSNRGAGTISLISFRLRRVIGHWTIPGHASPDMGGVSADGRLLWLTGRYDSELYAISTRTGRLVHRIPVEDGPHGAAVWPQPGRYSIGHTGIMR